MNLAITAKKVSLGGTLGTANGGAMTRSGRSGLAWSVGGEASRWGRPGRSVGGEASRWGRPGRSVGVEVTASPRACVLAHRGLGNPFQDGMAPPGPSATLPPVPPTPRPGRWLASRRERRAQRRPYREPAPDPASRPPPTIEESGSYQALREHWLVRWLRRVLDR